MKDIYCDFILMSSSQMTTHMFQLKTKEEIISEKEQQSQRWAITSLFQSTKEYSKVVLRVEEELDVKPNQFGQGGGFQTQRGSIENVTLSHMRHQENTGNPD